MPHIGRTDGLIHSPIGAAFGLLAAHEPQRPLLNLSQAAPSFMPPPVVVERVAEVAATPDGARYVPQEGLPPLRAALADELTRLYPGRVETDEVLITAGSNQAFCVAASALTSPGDNIVVARSPPTNPSLNSSGTSLCWVSPWPLVICVAEITVIRALPSYRT